MRFQIALGGALLFASLVLFLFVVAATWMGPRSRQLSVSGSIPPALSGPEDNPRVLDSMKLWTAIAVLLVLLTYGPPLVSLAMNWTGSAPIPV